MSLRSFCNVSAAAKLHTTKGPRTAPLPASSMPHIRLMFRTVCFEMRRHHPWVAAASKPWQVRINFEFPALRVPAVVEESYIVTTGEGAWPYIGFVPLVFRTMKIRRRFRPHARSSKAAESNRRKESLAAPTQPARVSSHSATITSASDSHPPVQGAFTLQD